ncbi:TPA: glutamate-5-semialdehyde dehydrogenase [Campylobacter jejuni]|nr:glutamate-5-semialdehyde dehydrogenase [Campylobacter jejuni]HDZ5125232.1 glutamate-5-semialdehyde dehydrogenase [Campylobacter jejuni]HED8363845.1 glutamate-5-semialdehyde dehydrogenase [Campylobacter jejuni]
MRNLLENIKKNSQKLLNLTPKDKEKIILNLAQILKENFKIILEANEKDMANFTKGGAMQDRLLLDEKRILSLCESLEKIAYIKDPIGKISKGWKNYAGLSIQKISIPLGLICVIYEARPSLSAEIVALMIKSSNACVFKGGSEAKFTNAAMFALIFKVLKKFNLQDCFAMFYERNEIMQILAFDDLIDVIIPRGSSNMIQEIINNTKIPLIKQDKGLCHAFVDESANLDIALKIILNAKCQRVSVCNALETLLIHEKIAKNFINLLIPEFKKFKVKIHAHENTLTYFKNSNLEVFKADENTFDTEWLDFALSVKLVKDCNEAIEHINKHSSSHSETIISNNTSNIAKFQRLINSSCIYANASTRFSDGGEFGFGGEIGISTSKLHARGPMGVEDMCTYKYIINGEGQIRE